MTQGCAAKTCCPSGNVYTEAWAWMTSYYSPSICPSQYRSCPGASAPSALSTAPGETIAFCCPTSKLTPDHQTRVCSLTAPETITVQTQLEPAASSSTAKVHSHLLQLLSSSIIFSTRRLSPHPRGPWIAT
jgi:hypothetical protein